MKKIGLLAGVGKLPVEIAKVAQGMGMEVVCVALVDGVDTELQNSVSIYKAISIAQLNSVLNFLKENDVKDVVMIGKVTKEILMSGKLMPDEKALSILQSLTDYSDDTLMLAFVAELAKEGMTTFDQTTLIKMLMPQKGTLTKREATKEEMEDMIFGFNIAKELGRIDVGQTCVVKNKAVMALEAIEGTDSCILRGGKLANGGGVVAKVAKPMQDNRFDMPAIGTKTIESMIEARLSAIVIEAEKTLVVEREKVQKLADENNIAIVAM